MGKILLGLSDECVWLKSLAEYDNVDKEYVSLIIGLYKNSGSVLHLIISFLLIGPLYPARAQCIVI